jgi:hypothetical protein
MPDFSALLKKPIVADKAPPAIEAGNYPGIIKSFEYGDSNKNKTPYVRFHIGLTGWADNVEPQAGVDLSKKQMRRDFFLTDEARYRLANFIKSCGVALDDSSDYEVIIPTLVGTRVVAEVQQYLNQNSGEIGNQIGNLTGA